MGEITASRYVVTAGWQDVPHLDEKAKAELLESTLPHLRDARTKGEPTMGAGAVYPIPISDIECKPFLIPFGWKRAFALDVGWNRTACVWGAQHPADGTIYLYSEHYKGQALPIVHAAAIKTRGEWIRGCIDPASAGAGQRDGSQLREEYKLHGLQLIDANNEVETGILDVWQGLALGRIKVFSTLTNLKGEYRVYQRDDKGKIKDGQADHLMDCMRYLIRTWNKIATLPAPGRTGTSEFDIADTRAGY